MLPATASLNEVVAHKARGGLVRRHSGGGRHLASCPALLGNLERSALQLETIPKAELPNYQRAQNTGLLWTKDWKVEPLNKVNRCADRRRRSSLRWTSQRHPPNRRRLANLRRRRPPSCRPSSKGAAAAAAARSPTSSSRPERAMWPTKQQSLQQNTKQNEITTKQKVFAQTTTPTLMFNVPEQTSAVSKSKRQDASHL